MRPGRPTRRQWRPTDIIFGRAGLAFGVEGVEGVAEVGEEVLGGVEGAGREAHVVGLEGVGDDELLAAVVLAPVGEVVVVGVGDPVEEAGLGDEVDGLGGGAAGVPAARGFAGDLGVEADGFLEVGAFGLGGVVAVVDPAQAVGGDLPAGVLHGGDLGGGAGEGGGDAVDGDGEVAGDEEVAEAPEAGAGAVFVDATPCSSGAGRARAGRRGSRRGSPRRRRRRGGSSSRRPPRS